MKSQGFIKTITDLRLIIFLCLSLGLAPFVPEPHIWGKLKWISGGAEGMKMIDWFDLLFHGLPWLALIIILIYHLIRIIRKATSN